MKTRTENPPIKPMSWWPIYLGLVGSLMSLTGSTIVLIGLLMGDIQ